MNVRGRHTSIRLVDPRVLDFRHKRAIFKYKYLINKASYFTITAKSVVSAEKAALRRAKRAKDNLGTVKLLTITKIL